MNHSVKWKVKRITFLVSTCLSVQPADMIQMSVSVHGSMQVNLESAGESLRFVFELRQVMVLTLLVSHKQREAASFAKAFVARWNRSQTLFVAFAIGRRVTCARTIHIFPHHMFGVSRRWDSYSGFSERMWVCHHQDPPSKCECDDSMCPSVVRRHKLVRIHKLAHECVVRYVCGRVSQWGAGFRVRVWGSFWSPQHTRTSNLGPIECLSTVAASPESWLSWHRIYMRITRIILVDLAHKLCQYYCFDTGILGFVVFVTIAFLTIWTVIHIHRQ